MQSPDSSLHGIFLKVTFAASNFRENAFHLTKSWLASAFYTNSELPSSVFLHIPLPAQHPYKDWSTCTSSIGLRGESC